MRTLLLIAALAAACAKTPLEVRQSHWRFDFQSTRSLERAATCAARNAENIAGSLTTAVRPGPDENTMEVIVHADVGTFAVIDVNRNSAGTTHLRVWLTQNIGTRENLQDYATVLANKIASGC